MMILQQRGSVQFEPTAQQRATRNCLMQEKLENSLNIPSDEGLNHLRRRIQLYDGEIRASKEEMDGLVSKNNDIIETLQREIHEKRLACLVPGANEVLMRKALKDFHPGGSVFREKEPRDVNEDMDFKTRDLINKRNRLRNERERKLKRLNDIMVVFNDTVEDVVYLEFEGPIGDSQCLDLGNHIAAVGKRYLEAERLHRTYKHVRDQLAIERRLDDMAIETVTVMIKKQEEEAQKVEKSMEASVLRKDIAITVSIMTEVDNKQQRKDRACTITDMKKKVDEHKHECMKLSRNIQLYFSTQETMRLGHTVSTTVNITEDFSEAEETLKDLMAQSAVFQNCTATHSIQEVVNRFEEQRDTQQQQQSMGKELEMQKLKCVSRLRELTVMRNATVFHDRHPEDCELERVELERRESATTLPDRQWSSLAATTRVTQALVRVRQLLEYLVSALVSANLMRKPPRRLTGLDTEQYLTAMVALALSGVTQLMSVVGPDDPEQTMRRAVAAQFGLTRSEAKMKALARRALLTASVGAATTDEGETTSSEVALAGRTSMKQSAQQLVHAKIKAGFGKKKL